MHNTSFLVADRSLCNRNLDSTKYKVILKENSLEMVNCANAEVSLIVIIGLVLDLARKPDFSSCFIDFYTF